MSAAKPEVLLSQLIGHVETKFQMIYPHFRGPALQWNCCLYDGMKPEVRNQKWRPSNRKYLYLSSQVKQKRNSKCYTHTVRVQLLSKVVMSTVESNRKSEFKYGGRQTGCTYILRATTDRHAVPVVILRFSGSPDSTDSSPTSANVDRYRKRKMATARPEIVLYPDRKQTDMRFQWLQSGFWCHLTRLLMQEIQNGLLNWMASVLTRPR